MAATEIIRSTPPRTQFVSGSKLVALLALLALIALVPNGVRSMKGDEPKPGAKGGAPVTQADILADIKRSQEEAKSRGYEAGTEDIGGVDCIDACVFFNGLIGETAADKLTDLKAKLVLSPGGSDYAAHYVRRLYDQPYEVAGTIGDPDKQVQDLMIAFGYFYGADSSLGTLPKGTKVINSVRDKDTGLIREFEQVLQKDRATLFIRKDGKEFRVFTTCGNGAAPFKVLPAPLVPERPQREFKCPPGSGLPGGPACGSSLSGPEQQMHRSDQVPTPGYVPGNAETVVSQQSTPTNPYSPNPIYGSDSGSTSGAPAGQTTGSGGTEQGTSAGTDNPESTEGSGSTNSGDPGEP